MSSEEEEEEEHDWNIELHEAARGGSMVPAATEDDGAPAAALGGVELAQLALEQGADLHAEQRATGLTALGLAMKSKGAVLPYVQTCYLFALLPAERRAGLPGGDVEHSEEEKRRRAGSADRDPTALLVEACREGDLPLARRARSGGAQLTVVDLAARAAHQQAVALEIDEDDDDAADRLAQLNEVVAALREHLDRHSAVRQFLIDEMEGAPGKLLDAARIGNLKLAQLARAAGAALDVVDAEYHYTPLHWAARHGSTEMLGYLLDEGAAIDAQCPAGSYRGSTALLEATAWSVSTCSCPQPEAPPCAPLALTVCADWCGRTSLRCGCCCNTKMAPTFRLSVATAHPP